MKCHSVFAPFQKKYGKRLKNRTKKPQEDKALLWQGMKKPQESIRPPVANLLVKENNERFSILH